MRRTKIWYNPNIGEVRDNFSKKGALDRGEDIEQIMMDTRKEMMQLANYRREIEHQP